MCGSLTKLTKQTSLQKKKMFRTTAAAAAENKTGNASIT